MKDRIDEIRFYLKSKDVWKDCWHNTEILKRDFRGVEITKQLIRSVGSISANIEEGYGRGFGKEYPQFLRIARGSARESKGWYFRSGMLLPPEIINLQTERLDEIISALTNSINTLTKK
jgi:four helix bundle protein